MKAIIAYVPVLHEGYRKLFAKHAGAVLYLVGPDQLGDDFPRLGRDLRALPVEDMRHAVLGMDILQDVQVLHNNHLNELNERRATVIMPVDEISTRLAVRLGSCSVVYEEVFLRWNKPVSLAETTLRPDCTVTEDECHRCFITSADEEARKSSDWWRQVGAVAVRDGTQLFVGFNAHHPSEQAVFAAGNPRDNFDAGEHLEISDTLHGEAGIVARAARKILEGADIYVTTFPCYNCARLLAEAGIKRIFYRDGYSRLDAETVLKDYGIELIRVV